MDLGKRSNRRVARAAWRTGVVGLGLLWLSPPPAAQTAPGGLRAATAAASTLRTFPGLDYTISRGSDGLFRPPDTTLGTNGSVVLEGTNSAIRLMTANGAEIATTSLNSFFGASETLEKVLFDPRVVYSRLGPYPRFFVVALHRNEEFLSASIHLAVSRSESPNNLSIASWCRYNINSVRDNGTTWADFPMVGVGADAFLISNDQFTFPNPGYKYQYGILRVINKNVITNNASGPCPSLASVLALTQELPGTRSALQTRGHVQPVVHNTAPSSFFGVSNPAYLVSTVTPAPTSTTYRVFRVRNVSVGTPTVDAIDITGGQYRMLPSAKQPSPPPPQPPSKLLDLNDTRVLQVAGIGDTLFATFATGCPQPGLPDKPCVRVVRFFVSDSGGSLSAIIQEDVTIKSDDSEVDLGYFMPGIAATASGQTAVVVLTSSPSRHLSAAWTVKNSIEPFYPTPTLFSAGTCIKTATTSKVRIGDYVGAQTDPGALSNFWLAGESAAVDGFGGCTWKTQVTQVAP